MWAFFNEHINAFIALMGNKWKKMTREYGCILGKKTYSEKLDFSYQSSLGMCRGRERERKIIQYALGSSAFCFFYYPSNLWVVYLVTKISISSPSSSSAVYIDFLL